ncbi:MAG: helix-turn-helix transcriptional regulator [Bacteroidaceae bacterium]|nr:helix-turn-helix transcriptional regulator [Bacteroidaceae bacterium]
MNPHSLPHIAIISPNTLACLGLSGIIRSMMPEAEVSIFSDLKTLKEADQGQFFHYFIASRILMEDASYFLERRRKTIVLLHGQDNTCLPASFHTLNVNQSEQQLVRSFLLLAQTAHGTHPPVGKTETFSGPQLTPRETEVLRLIVSGLINKEIADRLNVGLTTVISHRKNLIEKLGIKSVSGLTIYAVTNGIIRTEEI